MPNYYDLGAIIPAGQLAAAMRNLLCLDDPNSRVTEPIDPDLVYLPRDPQDLCDAETRGEHRHYIELSAHEGAPMRWLEGYPAEAVVSCSFHFMDATGFILPARHLPRGHVKITLRDDGDFDLLVTDLVGKNARDLTDFPIDLFQFEPIEVGA
jgi:hypothetical protein